MVIDWKGVGVHPPPSPARADFFHHDGMYARNWQSPLCVYSVEDIIRLGEGSLVNKCCLPGKGFDVLYGIEHILTSVFSQFVLQGMDPAETELYGSIHMHSGRLDPDPHKECGRAKLNP